MTSFLPNRNVYAKKGDKIFCENGHHICSFAEDVYCGTIPNTSRQLTDWQQLQPNRGDLVGAPHTKCDICGGLYWHGNDGGFHLRFQNGWKVPPKK
jgi:hypothetical protein